MKQNPCRYCALSTEVFGKYYSSHLEQCRECENLKKHREYLKAHRKFIEGEPITDLTELLQQEWVMWYHQTKHIEVFKSTQLRLVLRWLEIGAFRKVIRREEVNNGSDSYS